MIFRSLLHVHAQAVCESRRVDTLVLPAAYAVCDAESTGCGVPDPRDEDGVLAGGQTGGIGEDFGDWSAGAGASACVGVVGEVLVGRVEGVGFAAVGCCEGVGEVLRGRSGAGGCVPG